MSIEMRKPALEFSEATDGLRIGRGVMSSVKTGVPPHTPLRTIAEGSVIRALVGHDDERHCRIRSIGERVAEGVGSVCWTTSGSERLTSLRR